MSNLIDKNSTSDSDNAFVEVKDGDQSGDTAKVGIDKRLWVDANITGISLPIPHHSNKLRFISDKVPIIINSTSFVTLYEYSGTGNFFGWVGEYTSEFAITKVTIDGEEILSAEIAPVDDFLTILPGGSNSILGSVNANRFSTIRNAIDITLQYPIRFESYVRVEGKLSTGVPKQLTQQAVSIEQES